MSTMPWCACHYFRARLLLLQQAPAGVNGTRDLRGAPHLAQLALCCHRSPALCRTEKYRPRSIGEVAHQEEVVQTLQSALGSGHVSAVPCRVAKHGGQAGGWWDAMSKLRSLLPAVTHAQCHAPTLPPTPTPPLRAAAAPALLRPPRHRQDDSCAGHCAPAVWPRAVQDAGAGAERLGRARHRSGALCGDGAQARDWQEKCWTLPEPTNSSPPTPPLLQVRDKIKNFAANAVGQGAPGYPSPPFKVIILDEADAMTGVRWVVGCEFPSVLGWPWNVVWTRPRPEGHHSGRSRCHDRCELCCCCCALWLDRSCRAGLAVQQLPSSFQQQPCLLTFPAPASPPPTKLPANRTPRTRCAARWRTTPR